MIWKKVKYTELNSKQKERYNFAKVSAVLADYGYTSIWLDDDWNGADFLAISTTQAVLKIQLKGRLTFSKKYENKDLYICFRFEEADQYDSHVWYLYKHDELLEEINKITLFKDRESWTKDGLVSWGSPSKKILEKIQDYKIGSVL